MKPGRNETERLCLIVNPRSAGGATGRRLPEIERAAAAWFGAFEVRATEGPGHATELAAQAAREGFHVVAAVGGDGTAHEVVNGLFDGDVPRGDAVFTVIPAGTGSDLVKTLRVPGDVDSALAVAAHGETRPSDLIRVSYKDEAGADGSRLCVNVAGFGMNGDVVRLANQSTKRLGGTLTFLGATVQTLWSYQPQELEVRWTDEHGREQQWRGEVLSAFAANGQYCGGGMWVGRGGSMQDGLMDLTILPNLSLARTALGAPRLFTGTMEKLKGVVRVLASSISASVVGGGLMRLDLDGEQPGVLPVQLRVLPGVLGIRGRW